MFQSSRSSAAAATQSFSLQPFDAEKPKPPPPKSDVTKAMRPARVSQFKMHFIDAFFEKKGQEADTEHLNDAWQQTNPDLMYCAQHKEVTEAVQFWPEECYNKLDCAKCVDLKALNPVSKRAFTSLRSVFILPESEAENTMQTAEAHWITMRKELIELSKSATPEEKNRANLKERSAWLNYCINADQLSNERVTAIREYHTTRKETQRWKDLTENTNPELIRFFKYLQARNRNIVISSTPTQGVTKFNFRLCDIHCDGLSGSEVHNIQVFNKHRYEICGICIKPRVRSGVEAEADAYNRSDKSNHPRILPKFESTSSSSSSSNSSSSSSSTNSSSMQF
jgi:hypothetical protein